MTYLPDETTPHPADAERLDALARHGSPDAAHGGPLDRLARLAARVTSTPMAVVHLRDGTDQGIGHYDVTGAAAGGCETSPDSLWRRALAGAAPLVVPDVGADPALARVAGARHAGLGAYACVPLDVFGQEGGLCVADTAPRRWTDADIHALADVAAVAAGAGRRADPGSDTIGAALRVMGEGVVMHAPDGEIVACNPAAERILGLTADQMRGRTSMDPRWRATREDGSPFPGEDHPAMVTLRTGRAQHGVIMGVHRPDGSLVRIMVSSEPVGGPDGPQGVVATFVDVTDLYERGTEASEGEERFRALAHLAPVAMAEICPGGSCRWVNREWAESVGPSAEGSDWAEVIHPDDREAVVGLCAAAAGGAEDVRGECRFTRPSGRTAWASVQALPVRSGDGALLGCLLALLPFADVA